MKPARLLPVLLLLPVLAAAADEAPPSPLEAVLAHYREEGDAQKLAAARFLIDNMEEHGYAVAALYDGKDEEIPFDALDYPDLKSAMARLDLLEKEHGTLDFHRKRFEADADTITAEYLIGNIDLAFRAWRERPWAKEIPFELFREHILPYRGSNEPLGDWRRPLFEEMADLPGRMEDPTDFREAARLVRAAVAKKVRFSDLYYLHPTDQGYEEMLASGLGRCEDITNFATYAFRANAIPSAEDYTPWWPNRDNNHAWEVILDADGRGHAKLGNPAAKVFRKTFSIRPESLGARLEPDEKAPRWLAGKNYRDVTADYVPVTDVTIELANPAPEGARFAYLAVFNGGEWRAIAWGTIADGRASFAAMGRGIAYLPVYYGSDEDLVPAAPPFLLGDDGAVTRLDGADAAESTLDLELPAGRTRELLVWEDGWRSLGVRTGAADATTARFTVPVAGRLFWWTEPDGRKLERIFTVEDGRPRSW